MGAETVNKITLQSILEALGYAGSPNYLRANGKHHPLTAHLFRSAQQAGADGAYVVHASSGDEVLPPRAAVFVAKAANEEEARLIHRRLWNLGNAPFVIIVMPGQIRVYTGFDYDGRNAKKGLIKTIDLLLNSDLGDLRSELADYDANSIDSGAVWTIHGDSLLANRRVDFRLLENLKNLGQELVRRDLDAQTAHALIGKYVYFRYLNDRKVLSDPWLDENGIDRDKVFGRGATISGLRDLVELLDDRFNGNIFPFPTRGPNAPTNDHVQLVAAAFKGDDPFAHQMHLDFEPYDFSYIPIETLSLIYEEFLRAQGLQKKAGAVYTPEPLADYVLAELNSVKSFVRGMQVLDPCCGSGIFLVLAYRRLIEEELKTRPDGRIRPSELRQILTESIFGVERNIDACRVTELSLILTLLHYVDPPELHRNKGFKFPELHDRQIFHADFFDDQAEFWAKEMRFDWIVGNPPWIEPNSADLDERYVLEWMSKSGNRKERPTLGNRVSEAFSWRVAELSKDDGCIGLLVHATSLFNLDSSRYRKEFFRAHRVHRVTNFTNLAYVLFAGRGEAPAATLIYQRWEGSCDKPGITHYGPFAANQGLTVKVPRAKKTGVWALTVNESEIQSIPHEDAETGEGLVWKLALWGSRRDRSALRKLQRLFPICLGDLAKRNGWHTHVGLELVERPERGESPRYELVPLPELKGNRYLDASAMVESKLRFQVPPSAFRKLPADHCFLRKRAGRKSLQEVGDAHLILHANYMAFTSESFLLRAPSKRLSAPRSAERALRALSVFLNSSVVKYWLFFQSPTWGVDRTRVYADDLRRVPVPEFSREQEMMLAELHHKLVRLEADGIEDREDLQWIVDREVSELLRLPQGLTTLARDFVAVRLSLNKGKTSDVGTHAPSAAQLGDYGEVLRNELDTFTRGRVRHKISLTQSGSDQYICCAVELRGPGEPASVTVGPTSRDLEARLSALKARLRQRFSQWVYVQRGFRYFDDSCFFICRMPRLMDWTQTQALRDSDDLIAEILSRSAGEEAVQDVIG